MKVNVTHTTEHSTSSKIDGVPSAALAMKTWNGTPLGVVNSSSTFKPKMYSCSFFLALTSQELGNDAGILFNFRIF